VRFGYPVSLELRGRRAVVIGKEAVRQGKAEGLIGAGAEVTVIAPGPGEAIARLERGGRARVIKRGFRPGDLSGAFVCVASSDDPQEREAIYAEGQASGCLVNVMDDPEHCDWAAPAIVRRGDLVIAISTGGRSPALAARLRRELSEQYGPEWEPALDVLEHARAETLPALPDLAERSRRWNEALDLDELLRLVREDRASEAERRLVERLVPAGAR
jgi:precorrin-2 dehydrogenase/sirohydrochlorin ferrochelatase